MTRLSVVTITKNSEKRIGKVVRNGLQIGDEVTVVDTGSIDKTIEVAASAGAKVISMNCFPGFAIPKNVGARCSSGDWVFHLDTDEDVDSCFVPRIRSAIESGKYDMYLVAQVSIRSRGCDEMLQPRLYKRNKFRYGGNMIDWLYPLKPWGVAEVLIDHKKTEAKLREETLDPKKIIQRRELAENDLKLLGRMGFPEDLEKLAEIVSRCKNMLGRSNGLGLDCDAIYNTAFIAYQKGLSLGFSQELVQEMSHLAGLVGRKAISYEIIKNYPDFSSLHPFYLVRLGRSCFGATGNIDLSVEALDRAIELDPCSSYHLIKSQILLFGGKLNQSNESFKKALELLPERKRYFEMIERRSVSIL